MSAQTDDECWADASNWRMGEYRCAGDSRLWVAKRFGTGITLNMAHRYAWPSAILTMLALFVPFGGVLAGVLAGITQPAILATTIAFGLGAALAVYWLARRARNDQRAAG